MNLHKRLIPGGCCVAAIVLFVSIAAPASAQQTWEAGRTGRPTIDPAGNAVGGFTLSLVNLDQTTMAGRAWTVRLAIRNETPIAKVIAFAGSGCNYAFSFREEGSGTMRFVRPRSCEVYSPDPITLEPGKATFLLTAVLPDDNRALQPGAIDIVAQCDIRVASQNPSGVRLTSNAVPTTVVADDRLRGPGSVFGSSYMGLSSSEATGSATGRFALSIQPPPSSVRAGAVWSLNVELRNLSREPQSVPLPTLPCISAFTFRNDATGAAQSFTSERCDVYGAGVRDIPPGRSYFFTVTFEPYDVALSPGTFSIWALARVPNSWTDTHGISVTSNIVTLRVTGSSSRSTSSPGSRDAAAPHR
jgi:hypothetical protein